MEVDKRLLQSTIGANGNTEPLEMDDDFIDFICETHGFHPRDDAIVHDFVWYIVRDGATSKDVVFWVDVLYHALREHSLLELELILDEVTEAMFWREVCKDLMRRMKRYRS